MAVCMNTNLRKRESEVIVIIAATVTSTTFEYSRLPRQSCPLAKY